MASGKLKIKLAPRLRDADLLSPTHDEIAIWLDSHLEELFGGSGWDWDEEYRRERVSRFSENLEETISELEEDILRAEEKARAGTLGGSPASEELDDMVIAEVPIRGIGSKETLRWAKRHLLRLKNLKKLPAVPNYPGIRIEEKAWQYPIHSGRGTIIGFVDLAVNFSQPELGFSGFDISYFLQDDDLPGWEIVYDQPEWHYFDIRVDIESLSSLLREIKYAKEHLPGRFKYYVVSPEKNYASILEAQGIEFIHFDRAANSPS